MSFWCRFSCSTFISTQITASGLFGYFWDLPTTCTETNIDKLRPNPYEHGSKPYPNTQSSSRRVLGFIVQKEAAILVDFSSFRLVGHIHGQLYEFSCCKVFTVPNNHHALLMFLFTKRSFFGTSELCQATMMSPFSAAQSRTSEMASAQLAEAPCISWESSRESRADHFEIRNHDVQVRRTVFFLFVFVGLVPIGVF